MFQSIYSIYNILFLQKKLQDCKENTYKNDNDDYYVNDDDRGDDDSGDDDSGDDDRGDDDEWLFNYSHYDEQEIIQISEKICKNIQTMTDPTFDEINEILITVNYLLENDKLSYEDLILKCPYKFMMTYANNSERTPRIINYIKKFNPILANKILEYANDTHKNTWNERKHFI
jgi:hypothetical protein